VGVTGCRGRGCGAPAFPDRGAHGRVLFPGARPGPCGSAGPCVVDAQAFSVVGRFFIARIRRPHSRRRLDGDVRESV